jgi:hypothetical protein
MMAATVVHASRRRTAVSIWQYRSLVTHLSHGFKSVAGVPGVASWTPLQLIAMALTLIGLFAFGAALVRAV